ncbi:peptidoglycan recognition protein family protein [Inediibacterium massiliense]|uniref:peptidoglycan recognition protein family protein n=1 Tax=Inediibacterium massiliense TaxID=1658111 RepID=UPI0006B4E9FA|nr:N-acetylmuramoyl-L-alanine amidase [Inediibacterium massiliense]
MKYIVDHIPKNTNKRPCISMIPQYITIHSTGNPNSTAKNERDNLARVGNTRQASFHIVVDDLEAIECIPLNEVAWHAGDGRGKGNMASISIEICESGNREKTLANAVELVTKLLHERNWYISNLKRHYDWSKKNCPRILNYNNWEGWKRFMEDVHKKLEEMNKPQPHWAEKHFKNLNNKGMIIREKRFEDGITRAEVFALLDQIVK